MITLVEPEESWGIYGPGIDEPRLFSDPSHALSHMIMNPAEWPEEVDFWLALCAQGGMEHEALAFEMEGLKRPSWATPSAVRTYTELGYRAVAVDFWFIAKFLQSLALEDYRYVRVPVDDDPHDADICSGSYALLQLNVRQKADWATNFPLVVHDDTLRFMGLRLISEAGPGRGMRRALRYRKWP